MGEKLSLNGENVDLFVSGLNPGSVKVSGEDNIELEVGDVLTGQSSSNIAKIEQVKDNEGRFEISFSNKKK